MGATKKIEIERRDKVLDAAWKEMEMATSDIYYSNVLKRLLTATEKLKSFDVPSSRILAFYYKTLADLMEETL